jgi:hypothetical protein
MAMRWQMPFVSSRGYSSLTLQHDVADMLIRRFAQTGQMAKPLFVSDLDASGLDLVRAWQQALRDFGVPIAGGEIIRIGLTPEQVRDNVDVADRPLAELSIGVKDSDSRARSYIAEHRRSAIYDPGRGDRCWEADILPPTVIEQAIDAEIRSWLDGKLWDRRAREIDTARELL